MSAYHVAEKFQDFGNQTPFNVGYILWAQGGLFTHVANVLVPNLTVLSYTRDFSGKVLGKAPAGGHLLPFHIVEQWTVLDLYFKKVTTVGQWWRDVSYVGWGTLTIDPSGQFINE